jgi:hypothetical protein
MRTKDQNFYDKERKIVSFVINTCTKSEAVDHRTEHIIGNIR